MKRNGKNEKEKEKHVQKTMDISGISNKFIFLQTFWIFAPMNCRCVFIFREIPLAIQKSFIGEKAFDILIRQVNYYTSTARTFAGLLIESRWQKPVYIITSQKILLDAITWDNKCLALIAQVVGAFGMNLKVGVRVPLRSRHFLSLNLRHFQKNIPSWVENECCCSRTINISNVNYT